MIGGGNFSVSDLLVARPAAHRDLGAAAHRHSATGSSASAATGQAARNVGVPVDRVKILLFMGTPSPPGWWR